MWGQPTTYHNAYANKHCEASKNKSRSQQNLILYETKNQFNSFHPKKINKEPYTTIPSVLCTRDLEISIRVCILPVIIRTVCWLNKFHKFNVIIILASKNKFNIISENMATKRGEQKDKKHMQDKGSQINITTESTTFNCGHVLQILSMNLYN